MPSSALQLRPQTAPYLSRCGPSRLLAGLGDRAWAGERRCPPPRSRDGASRRAPCSRPRPCRCRRRSFSTVDSSHPLATAPSAGHGPGSPASRPRRRSALSPSPRRLRADFRERRGGSPPPRLPQPPPPSLLRAPFHAPESAHQALRTQLPGGAGRGGAGSRGARRRRRWREGRAAGTGFSASWGQTHYPSPSPLPPSAPQKRYSRPLGFLEHFGAPILPSSEF